MNHASKVCLASSVYFIRHISQILYRVIFPLFLSLKNVLNDKITFLRGSSKNVWGKLLEVDTDFYFRGINKLPGKWQEVIKNNSEYTFDWNQLVAKLFMNKFILLKRKLFSTQPNTHTHTHTHTYSYIYRERERVCVRESERILKRAWNYRPSFHLSDLQDKSELSRRSLRWNLGR